MISILTNIYLIYIIYLHKITFSSQINVINDQSNNVSIIYDD